MRCPQCTERNSVAARKCEFCGERFKRKPVATGLKLGVAGVALALTASIAASYVVPTFTDPQQNLERVGKRLAAGPKSPEDATKIKKEFVEAVRAYLKNNGEQRTEKLSENLKKLLPSSAFEIHIAELPRGMRVVEVDTVLQATDYLVMKTTSGSKVFDLPGFDVFDDARIINDQAGPVLTLVGHTSGPPPHKPQIRTFALLPDHINDETSKMVPTLIGDGQAKFSPNNQDLLVELLMPANSKPNKLAAREDYTYGVLTWKNARYVSDFGANGARTANAAFRSSHVAYVPPAKPAVAPKPATTTNAASASVKAPTTQASTAPAKIVVRGLTDNKPPVVLAAAPVTRTNTMPPVAPSITPIQNQPIAAAAPVKEAPAARPAETKASGSKSTAEVICSGATLRSGPRRGSAPMANLERGTAVSILGRDGDWYHVRYQGSEGYIFAPLLNSRGAATSVASAPSTSGRRSRHKQTSRNSERVLIAQLPPAASSKKSRSRKRSHAAEVETPILVP